MDLFKKIANLFKKKRPEAVSQKVENTPENKQDKDDMKQLYTENKTSCAVPGVKVDANALMCTANHDDQYDMEEIIQKNPDNCKTTKLSIKKDGRDFQLDVPKNNFTYFNKEYQDVSIFEVVSGPVDKPITITIISVGLVGPCPDTHQNHAFNFSQSDIQVLSMSDKELKFTAFSRKFTQSVSIAAFIQLIRYIFNRSSVQYNIDYSLCGFDHAIILKVFPKISASAEFLLDIKWKYAKEGDGFLKLTNVEHPEGGFWDNFNFQFKAEHDAINLISISKENKGKEEKTELEKFIEAFNKGFGILNDGLAVFLSESQTIEVKINPKLKASCSLVEVENLPFVDTKFEVDLGFSPLVGVAAKVDVSGALLSLIPGVGPFLNNIVNAAKNVKLVDIFLGLVINGDLTLNSTFTKYAGKKIDENDMTISFSGKITLDFKGRVASEHNVWRLHYAIGAEVGAESGIKVEETKLVEGNYGLYCPLKITFLGILLYYQTWVNLGVSTVNANKIPAVARDSTVSVVGKQQIEDPQDLPDSNKYQWVKPSTLYDRDLYIIGGK